MTRAWLCLWTLTLGDTMGVIEAQQANTGSFGLTAPADWPEPWHSKAQLAAAAH